MRLSSGFTLLELLIVIALLALLMGVGAYMLPRNEPALQDSATNAVMQLESAGREAIRSGVPVDIKCDSLVVAGGSAIGKRGTLRSICAFAGSKAGTATFYPDGSATGGTVDLLAGDARIRLVVEPLSGKVSFD